MKRYIPVCLFLFALIMLTGNLSAQTKIGQKISSSCNVYNGSVFLYCNTTATPIKVRVFPNPVRDNLKLYLSYAQSIQVNIYNINGQLVGRLKPAASDLIEINCSCLAGGMYILQAVSQKGNTGSAIFMKE